jgi:hypothetical protein
MFAKMRTLSVSAAMLVAACAQGSIGMVPCGSDQECKGDRICDAYQHICVSPPLPSVNADGANENIDMTSTDIRPAKYLVAVNRIGAGTGTLSSEPAGILCGVQCQAAYPLGTSLKLSVKPDGRSFLQEWSGNCLGQDICRLTVDKDVSAIANISTWDAGSWTERSSITGHISTLWGSSTTDLWAGGSDGIWHWNGSNWILAKTGIQWVMDIWGFGSNDVWAAGDDASSRGAVYHWDGSSWSSYTGLYPGGLRGIWGMRPDDMWAVGYDKSGTIKPGVLHWDGRVWQSMTHTYSGYLWAVHGSSKNDVWAVGENGTIHWDGSSWSISDVGNYELQDVWAVSANDVWAVGATGTIRHWDGSRWNAVSSGLTDWITGIWARQQNDIWAVALGGVILHWNGYTWTSDIKDNRRWHDGIWGNGRDIWIGANAGYLIHYAP